MQIKANEPLRDLAGEPLKTPEGELTQGYAIANILLSSQMEGKMKLFVLADKFYKNEKVEVDKADLSLIKKSIEQDRTTNNLVSGQLLLMIDNLKDEGESTNRDSTNKK